MRLRRRRNLQATGKTDRVDPQIAEIQQRLAHLESELEGLQDALYRESVRQDKQIHSLIESTQPSAVARALSDDARRRGV
jgi:restriction endonuclease S subunit